LTLSPSSIIGRIDVVIALFSLFIWAVTHEIQGELKLLQAIEVVSYCPYSLYNLVWSIKPHIQLVIFSECKVELSKGWILTYTISPTWNSLSGLFFICWLLHYVPCPFQQNCNHWSKLVHCWTTSSTAVINVIA